MCNFFSFCGDGYGNYIYSDWKHRKEDLKQNWDSHTKIMTDQGIPNVMQDRWSKYEYNPLTKKFCVDGGIEGHDHAAAEYWVNQLDFSGVVKPLVIKPVRNPLTGRPKEITEKEINLLRKWVSVRDSVRGFVGDYVGDSIWNSVGDYVGDSIWNSVRVSVCDSVCDSVWAYVSSFFDIPYAYDFSSCVQLWEAGFLPVYNGQRWMLMSGKKTRIAYKIKT
jgi:hypothetical protein